MCAPPSPRIETRAPVRPSSRVGRPVAAALEVAERTLEETKAKLAALPKGELMVRHPHFAQPVFVRFPRPAVLSGREGVERFPQAADPTLDEAIDAEPLRREAVDRRTRLRRREQASRLRLDRRRIALPVSTHQQVLPDRHLRKHLAPLGDAGDAQRYDLVRRQ